MYNLIIELTNEQMQHLTKLAGSVGVAEYVRNVALASEKKGVMLTKDAEIVGDLAAQFPQYAVLQSNLIENVIEVYAQEPLIPSPYEAA